MLLVGLTGGLGSGQSTVSAMIAEHGAVIVDADAIARSLQGPNSPVLARMAERFGQHIIRADGSLDRAAVATIVFGDDPQARTALADLNGIVHPAMQAEIERQIQAHSATDRVVVLDFPLLLEQRGMDEQDARKRITSQVSREYRLGQATHVVHNDGGLDELRAQVDALWSALLAVRDSRS